MIGVTVLGATGSIGTSTLDVLARHRDRYRVVALTAHCQDERLFEQCRQFEPEYAVLVDPDAAQRLQQRVARAGLATEVLAGSEALERVATLPQSAHVMAAIVGAAGLHPALAAAQAGKRVLLANKEALVVSGALFMAAVQQSGAELLPIDSEHNAIFQCLPGGYRAGGSETAGVRRILLTASGGPFREASPAQLAVVTPEQACAHPNWAMGRKISVDSATLMNKGLELIEACWLFGVGHEQVEVVVHPQSVIHSLVEYVDSSVLAQLGNPDMRTPIAHALAWPERMEAGVAPLDLFQVARLDFEPPDLERFPCLRLAREAIAGGGTLPAVLNAANEVAVAAFLEREIAFLAIPRVIEAVLNRVGRQEVSRLASVLDADREAREAAWAWIADHARELAP